MRKNILSLSIAAMIGSMGLAGGVSAAVVSDFATATKLAVSPDGVGHILTVPYFSTQGGNMTLLNVVNTDMINGKAVKVRFRGASNSDDLLDFQVFLSPGDVWAANISMDPSGASVLTTPDNSCTLPAGLNSKGKFLTYRTNPTASDVNGETREGYVEILNMADIPPMYRLGNPADPLTGATVMTGSPAVQVTSVARDVIVGGTVNPLFTAIKHVNGVAPCSTGPLNALFNNEVTSWNGTLTQGATNLGLANPTGTLFANWSIFNVVEASSWSGAAAAVQAQNTAGASALGNVVLFPQANGTPAAGTDETADALFRTAGNPIQYFDLPDLSTPYADANIVGTALPAVVLASATVTSSMAQRSYYQAEKLTEALARTSIQNEFVNDDGVAGLTDWVVSMPTRRYNTVYNYAGGNAVFTDYSAVTADTVQLNNYFTLSAGPTVGNVFVNGKRQICVSGIVQTWTDRSEYEPSVAGNESVVSPMPPPTVAPGVTFCGEASVWSFNAGGVNEVSSLGAKVARGDLSNGASNGWATFATAGLGNGTAGLGKGLPVMGAAFMKLTNADPALGAGTSGNFGLTFPHRYTK